MSIFSGAAKDAVNSAATAAGALEDDAVSDIVKVIIPAVKQMLMEVVEGTDIEFNFSWKLTKKQNIAG